MSDFAFEYSAPGFVRCFDSGKMACRGVVLDSLLHRAVHHSQQL